MALSDSVARLRRGQVLPHFHQAALRHGFELDRAQQSALPHFQRLQDDLLDRRRRGRSWLRWFTPPQPAVRGLYLWGGVGRGKSFLMDEFHRFAPLRRKQRVHFHRFMQDVHHRLRALQGTADPLQSIGARIAQDCRLLCLDELQVSDIGDAMLLRGLLQALFDQGVALVTTSNQYPSELYEHGLQRAQFLPAIELILENMDVVELDAGQDYRLQTLQKAGVYHWPLDETAQRALEDTFVAVAGEPGRSNVKLEIDSRALRVRRLAPEVAWFEFDELCEGPRGTADYIELARRYHTIVLSGVPQFVASQAEALRRFTWLVDEFYDRRVKLIVAAAAPAEHLLDHVADFAGTLRTASRLIEMQGKDYLSSSHLA